jgi:hypothetical protein
MTSRGEVPSAANAITGGTFNAPVLLGGDFTDTSFGPDSPSQGSSRRPSPSDPPVRGPWVIGNIPQQPKAFQPRKVLVELLREQTKQSEVCVIHAMTGMRGIGKTQTAAAYARQRATEKWHLVAWISADTTTSILEGLCQIAAKAGIPARGDQPETAQAVRNWLQSGGERCLIVFDNAPEPDALRPYMPAVGAAHIVITSNRRSMTSLGHSVPVDVFSKSEALSYLAQRTGLDDTRGAEQLAEELGCLPLALAQAAAVITGQRISYATYLDRLRELPLSQYLTRTQQDSYPYAVAATIILSLQAACDSDSTGLGAPLMNLISVLSPTGVARSVLQTAYRLNLVAAPELVLAAGPARSDASLRPAEAVDAALAHLAEFSLLDYSLNGATVSAHRLTMRVLREQAAHNGTLQGVCDSAATVLTALTKTLVPVVAHARAVKDLGRHITALVEYSSDIGNLSGEPPVDIFELRGWLLAGVITLGDDPAQAVRVGQSLVSESERLLGSAHLVSVAARQNLAVAYQAAGRLADVITLYQDRAAERERILGRDHVAVVTAHTKLAQAYRDAGRAAEALPLYETTFAECKTHFGPDNPITRTAQANLTFARDAALRAGETVALRQEALAEREREDGLEHPATLAARNGLAQAYRDAGRLQEAIALHEVTLADCRRILGRDHPETLNSRSSLTYACQVAGLPVSKPPADKLRRRAVKAAGPGPGPTRTDLVCKATGGM